MNEIKESLSRRKFMCGIGATAAIPVLATACGRDSGQLFASAFVDGKTSHENMSANLTSSYVPVFTPGIATLSYEMVDGVKVFRLRAEPVTIQFQDMSDPHGMARRPIQGWGYNNSIVGPTIEAVEGDRVRILVENRLSEPTTMHWHGLHIPIEMDGVPGFSQKPIMPNETFTYEFTLEQHGTYFYHPHFMGAKQVGLGMAGFFIVHPKNPEPSQIVDKDFAYFLQIWMIHPGSPIPDTLEMTEFNYFTMNGRPGPDIVPMRAKVGEKVRIRVVNLSMMTHPIHLHGHSFRVTEYGAGFVPPSQQIIANTINIGSAEERSFEFIAGPRPGKWLFHCHFMHHVMNDMHRNPIPGTGGGHADHAGMEMGGMHTWIEVTN